MLADRPAEADEFYATVIDPRISDEDRHVARRAYAGLLWGKQLYRYDVEQWLEGDPAHRSPPAAAARRPQRRTGSTCRWPTSSRCRTSGSTRGSPPGTSPSTRSRWPTSTRTFAKEQLVLMCREWAMHPNGQLPAYEWEFGDVNPPVHAWAAWHVYRIDGYRDREFLVRVFTKLLLNFSWWVNRKDATGSNVFEGGFLGMDNIGLFNRSAPLPPGFRLEQSDATSWMAFYCQQMFKIALELSRHDKAWDDAATKFLEHFLSIAQAMGSFGSHGTSRSGTRRTASSTTCWSSPTAARRTCGCARWSGCCRSWARPRCRPGSPRSARTSRPRLRWLQRRRPELVGPLLSRSAHGGRRCCCRWSTPPGCGGSWSGCSTPRSSCRRTGSGRCPRGVHGPDPRRGQRPDASIEYEPGESRTGMFGGNSNWRGPVWFPVNVLLADKLRTYGRHFGDEFTIEIPTGSGNQKTLVEAADLIDGGLTALFRPVDGRRPADGERIEASDDPLWASTRPSASSSTATPARASAPPTRPAGPPWSPTCSTRGCPRIRAPRLGLTRAEAVGGLKYVSSSRSQTSLTVG